MAEPIWKDFHVDLGAPAQSGAGVYYYIWSVDKQAIIYHGTAFPKPGATNAIVRVNDIIADYIHNYFLTQPDASMPAKATFNIYTTGGLAASEQFYNDWSYDPFYNPLTDGMNFPPVLTFGPKELIPLSLFAGDPSAATIYMANGQTFSYTPTKMRGGDFNNDFNNDFLNEMQYFGDCYVLPMEDFPGAVKVVMNGKTYLASKYCPRYVLYYRNAYGGWDALPVEGRTREADSVTHFNNEAVYDNADPSARGKENYLNELKHTFEFCTGWLNNAQSSRMHHLLNSPSVFVHDMESSLIRPVVLTNPSTEYKEGKGGWHNYTIEAELAQNRIRR